MTIFSPSQLRNETDFTFILLGYLGYVCMFLHITYCIASVHMCFPKNSLNQRRKHKVPLHRRYAVVGNTDGHFEKPGNEIYMCDSKACKEIYQKYINKRLEEIIQLLLSIQVSRKKNLLFAKAGIFKFMCNRCRHKSM